MSIDKSDFYTSILDKLVMFIVSQDDEEEVWREITHIKYCNSIYFISNKGRVLSLYNNKPRILKPDTSSSYNRITINQKKRSIHRLVAEAFVPKEDGKDLVHHRNTVKSDNMSSNLQWVDELEHKKIHKELKKQRAS